MSLYKWLGDHIFGWETDAKYITRNYPGDVGGECFNMHAVARWAKSRGIKAESVSVDCTNPQRGGPDIIKNGHVVIKVTEPDGKARYIDSRGNMLYVVKAKWIENGEPYQSNQVGPTK